jgi:hypothetical protein
MNYEKPPIGVSPWWFWPQRRIKDLADGISRYSSIQTFDDNHAKLLKFWAQEIIVQCDNYIDLHKKYMESKCNKNFIGDYYERIKHHAIF